MCNIGSYKQDIVTFLFSLGCPHFQTYLAVIIFADNLLDNLWDIHALNQYFRIDFTFLQRKIANSA